MAKVKDIFDTAEEDTTSSLPIPEGRGKPRVFDPEWTDFILNQLTKDEKFEEYPKLDGLKRLLLKEYGDIESSVSEIVVKPSFDNMFTYVVEHTLVVNQHGGNKVTCKALAEATAENIDAPYDKYPAAIASTRAYGRAVRDMLKLKNVTAAEEMSKSDNADLAIKSQINGIYLMCKKLGLDVMKVINHSVVGKMIFDAPEKMDKESARACLVFLNQCQQNAKIAEDFK